MTEEIKNEEIYLLYTFFLCLLCNSSMGRHCPEVSRSGDWGVVRDRYNCFNIFFGKRTQKVFLAKSYIAIGISQILSDGYIYFTS